MFNKSCWDCFLWLNIWYILENVQCIWEVMYILYLFCEGFRVCYEVLMVYTVALLSASCWDSHLAVLSVECGILDCFKYCSWIVSSFSSVSIASSMCVGSVFRCIHVYAYYTFLMNILYHYKKSLHLSKLSFALMSLFWYSVLSYSSLQVVSDCLYIWIYSVSPAWDFLAGTSD